MPSLLFFRFEFHIDKFQPYLKLRHGEPEFKCDLCDYKAYTKCILKRHLAQKHNGVKAFKCDQCEYATGTGSSSFLCPKFER